MLLLGTNAVESAGRINLLVGQVKYSERPGLAWQTCCGQSLLIIIIIIFSPFRVKAEEEEDVLCFDYIIFLHFGQSILLPAPS